MLYLLSAYHTCWVGCIMSNTRYMNVLAYYIVGSPTSVGGIYDYRSTKLVSVLIDYILLGNSNTLRINEDFLLNGAPGLRKAAEYALFFVIGWLSVFYHLIGQLYCFCASVFTWYWTDCRLQPATNSPKVTIQTNQDAISLMINTDPNYSVQGRTEYKAREFVGLFTHSAPDAVRHILSIYYIVLGHIFFNIFILCLFWQIFPVW